MLERLCYTFTMKRPRQDRKKHKIASQAIDIVSDYNKSGQSGIKNPAAVALGRLGGKKGGKARARKLSSERRSEIARMAAKARWSKR